MKCFKSNYKQNNWNVFFSCYLTRLNPGIFSDLQNLEKLDLYNNELVELDKDIFKNLETLKNLSLRDNKIAK